MKGKAKMGPKSSSAAKGTKKVVAIASKEQHFRNVKDNLHALTRSERLTDLRFVCAFKNKYKTFNAHLAVMAPHSFLLQKLAIIAKDEQPGQPIFITLDNVDPALMEKLLQYMYIGEVSMQRSNKALVAEICHLLKLNITLDEPIMSPESSEQESMDESDSKKKPQLMRKKLTKVKKSTVDDSDDDMGGKYSGSGRRGNTSAMMSSEDDDDEVQEVKKEVKKKVAESEDDTPKPKTTKKATPAAAKRATPIFKGLKDDKDDDDSSDEEELMKLKAKAMSSKSTIPLVPVDKSTDSQVKHYLRRAMTAPAFAKTTFTAIRPISQKRKLSRSSSREKDSKKKMRCDSSGSDNNDSDDEPVKVASTKKSAATKADSDESDEPSSSSAPPKKKSAAGPASKKTPVAVASPKIAKKKPVLDNLFATQGVLVCDHPDCGAIFVTNGALQEHIENKHAGRSTDNDSDSDDESTVTKTDTKKKQRKQSSSSSNDSEDEGSSTNKKKGPRLGKTAAAKKDVSRTPARGGNGGAVSCTVCDEMFSNAANHKNHLVNHFKDQLMSLLPASKPFLCPECHSNKRDKTTLLRHFAYTHSKILEYCTEDDLAGKPANGGAASSSKKATPKAKPKSAKKATTSEVLTLDSSDDDGEEKQQEKEESGLASSTNGTGSSKLQPVKFSDDSDDDFAGGSSAATKAIKSFDELFGNEEKKSPEKKNPVVFNKDSDSEGDESDAAAAKKRGTNEAGDPLAVDESDE